MMNDNKFIVNGIDIDKCRYRYYSPSHVECKCEYTTRYGYEIDSYDFCRNNPNCYYKQLKRKEQECEGLSKQVEALNEKISRKKAVIEFADCPHYSYGDNTIEPTCTKKFCCSVKSCDYKNMVKYKRALDEIEKTINEDDFNLRPIDDNCDCYRGLEKDILDIINKAKENN